MTGRLIRPAMGLMLSLVVAACAQGQSNPTGPGASTGASGGASGSFTPAASPAADLGSAEMSLRQDDRTRAGLVNLGPGALDLAALMDQSGSVLLQKGLAALKAGTSGATLQVVPAVFADVPTPGQTIVGPWAITTQGFEILMSHDKPTCHTPPCITSETSDPMGEIVTVAG